MTNRKLSAFTLFEVLLAMAIAAIVIGMVFRGLSDIKSQLSLYQERAGFLADVHRGVILLRHDFSQAQRARTSGQTLYLASGSDTVFYYDFHPDFLVRRNSIELENTDTFPLATVQFQPFFAGALLPAAASDLVLADQIEWHFNLLGQTKHLHLRKEYPTLEFIRN